MSPSVERKIQQAREREAARLNAEVDEYLGRLLTRFNARDAALMQARLKALQEALTDVVAIDAVLLGGSVSKHTDVDGLSDVDALIVLSRPDLEGRSPEEVRAAFHAELDASLPRSQVASVRHGNMAVTITYAEDGMEIQLLPALRGSRGVLIGTPDKPGWSPIDPKRFQTALSSANRKLAGALVPAIKLLKAANADLPPQKQLSGYHIEAMAVDASRGYDGPKTPREVLIHLCEHSAARVLAPIEDITGQSRRVDTYLGPTNSVRRAVAAHALSTLARRLRSAGSLAEWKTLLPEQQ